MEADWAAEIGPGLDWIEGDWGGFVDLRGTPAAIGEIPEAEESSVLRDVLVAVNGVSSTVFSVKCDVWELGGEEIDPLEFDCGGAEAGCGMASWIDLIARSVELFGSFEGCSRVRACGFGASLGDSGRPGRFWGHAVCCWLRNEYGGCAGSMGGDFAGCGAHYNRIGNAAQGE
jgi:hypothetical protein